MLKIVKIGGNVVDNPAKLQTFLTDFATLEGPKILVHGGGKIATAISKALNIETIMIEGRRITDDKTLEVVTMVYNGINKQLVGTLQNSGCNAFGLCGADGRLIVSKKRISDPINYGFVGDPVSVDTSLVIRLLDLGFTPVIAPITYNGGENENGVPLSSSTTGLLNTNADTVAATMAVAMACAGNDNPAIAANPAIKDPATGILATESGTATTNVELVYCFEKQGVLLDVDDDDSVISHIDTAKFAELKAAGTIHSGMLPKLESAFEALEKGVGKVVICAAENIAKPGYGGTVIVK